MASAVASKGALLASLLKKLLAEPYASRSPVAYHALCPAAFVVAHRPYNTDGASLRRYDDGGKESQAHSDDSGREYEASVAADPRRARDLGFPSFFSAGC